MKAGRWIGVGLWLAPWLAGCGAAPVTNVTGPPSASARPTAPIDPHPWVIFGVASPPPEGPSDKPPATQIARSKGGKKLLTSANGVAAVWDLGALDYPATTIVKTGAAGPVALSPDGGRAAALTADDYLRVLDVTTGEKLLEVRPDWPPTALHFDATGRYLTMTTAWGYVEQFDVNQGLLARQVPVEVQGLAEGSNLFGAVGAGDDLIVLQPVANPRFDEQPDAFRSKPEVFRWPGGRALAEIDREFGVGCAFGGHAVVCVDAGKLFAFDAMTGHATAAPAVGLAPAVVALSPSGRELAVAGRDARDKTTPTLELWDLGPTPKLRLRVSAPYDFGALAPTDGDDVAVAFVDGHLGLLR